MDLELKDKTAIVTGGSLGIGKAITRELAREGVDVVICARRPDILETAARELEAETGRRILPVPADTTDSESVGRLVEAAVGEFGKVDILVNNAAVVGGAARGPVAEFPVETLMADVNTKVGGYIRCAKAVAPHMQRQGSGRIVNIGGLAARSSAEISGLRNISLVHLTKTLSDQLGPDGITVNLVHPGATRTERSGPNYAEQAREQGVTVEEIERRISGGNAIRRIVDAREIGHVVAFLCSPKAQAITGESIAAGGGTGRAVFQ